MKQMIKSLYTHAPDRFKTKLHNLLNSDGFYTNKSQNLIDRIEALSTPITDKELQKRVLKDNLLLVEIEIASFCNRTCWFCPNSSVDRKSKSIELPEKVFAKLIDNLAQIDYDKDLNFHRFNEPLADMELLLKRVSQARVKLPKARFTIFSNGDYIDRDKLEKLKNAGVNSMLMSYYYGQEKSYDKESVILPAMEKMRHKLGLDYKVREDSDQQFCVRFDYKDMEIYYRVWNPSTSGQSRGGAIESMKRARKVDSGCFQGAMNFYVDYNGLVMPCCHTRSDVSEHRDFIVGDCNTHDMFEIFFSPSFARLRAELFMSSPCSPAVQRICADCSDRRREQFLALG